MLGPKNQGPSIYKKELLSLITAVTKWKHCFLGFHFIIKTDHESLKYLLEKKISTPLQQKWLTKIQGIGYETQFKRGKENLVADALSRRISKEDPLVKGKGTAASILALSAIKPVWLSEVLILIQGTARPLPC